MAAGGHTVLKGTRAPSCVGEALQPLVGLRADALCSAYGHQSMHEGTRFLNTVAPHLGQRAFSSSLQISTSVPHCRQGESSGTGWRMLRLLGRTCQSSSLPRAFLLSPPEALIRVARAETGAGLYPH